MQIASREFSRKERAATSSVLRRPSPKGDGKRKRAICGSFLFMANDFYQAAYTKYTYICLTLKKLLTIFLALVIVSQSLVSVGIVWYYHINKTYISQKLCVNRSNPKMHCNGHCYLSKQLKKAEEGEQKQSQNILKEKDEIVSNNDEMISTLYLPKFTITAFNPFLSSPPVSDYRNELVKPPTV